MKSKLDKLGFIDANNKSLEENDVTHCQPV